MNPTATAEPLLIVNADDFGLTPGVCDAVLRASEQGIVTSTSALAVAPAFAAFARALRDSGIGVGGHLTVVGEDPPLLSATEVPTLVDRRGAFPLTWTSFMRASALGRVDTDDLRRELSAQLDALRSAGLTLTHLDSHQNLHLWPQLQGVLFELAATHAVGAVRVTRSASWSPVAIGVRALSTVLARRARARGLAFPDSSLGLDEAGHLDLPAMVEAVGRLAVATPGGGAAELATHPGAPDDPDRARYRWGYRWEDELAALCDPSLRDAVSAAGFRLGSFADLVERT